MKFNLLTLLLIPIAVLVSCKKNANNDGLSLKRTNDIVVPQNFTWESSRTIKFTVNVTDIRFQTAIQVIAIYDSNPEVAGANLLAKGSATISKAFRSSAYISKQVSKVYIVKYAPNNTQTTQIITIGTDDVNTSIGM